MITFSKVVDGWIRSGLERACQIKAFRWLIGGVWVKHRGAPWTPIDVFIKMPDGSLLLCETAEDLSVSSFHETCGDLEGLEKYL